MNIDKPCAMMAADWVEALSAAFAAGDPDAVTKLFAEDAIWRDHLPFSWSLESFDGRGAITEMLRSTMAIVKATGWALEGEPHADGDTVEGWLSFETALGRCKGYFRLRNGQCYTLLTALRELKGFEEARGPRRPTGIQEQGQTWQAWREEQAAALGHTVQPYVVVIGGGQGGLALGARLKALGVPALIVDRWPRIGDQWRSRYNALLLHDPVWYDHMPYVQFPDTWPVFTPKDKMGDWLEHYADIMELDVWTGAHCTSATYHPEFHQWQVEVQREGKTHVLSPTHLVIAVGNAGKPRMPQIVGMDRFAGEQLHSSAHQNSARFAGRRVAVIGSNNSAHDICADLVEHGAEVTMIQRSATSVWRQETLIELVFGALYSEAAVQNGITTEMADLLVSSVPFRLLPEGERTMAAQIRQRDHAFYQALENVGFMLPQGADADILFSKYLAQASGYYIDVGASALIAQGRIGLRSRVEVDHIDATGVVLSDASRVDADAIIYATGFGSMEEWTAELISPEVARKLGRCWGYGSGMARDPGPFEGEIRNMWKPTNQEALWFHGGNLAQSRHYSLYLALQLKARFENLPICVHRQVFGD